MTSAATPSPTTRTNFSPRSNPLSSPEVSPEKISMPPSFRTQIRARTPPQIPRSACPWPLQRTRKPRPQNLPLGPCPLRQLHPPPPLGRRRQPLRPHLKNHLPRQGTPRHPHQTHPRYPPRKTHRTPERRRNSGRIPQEAPRDPEETEPQALASGVRHPIPRSHSRATGSHSRSHRPRTTHSRPGTSSGGGSSAPLQTPEEHAAEVAILRDLRWLVHEGYVIEFIEGKIYLANARPPAHPAKKKQAPKKKRDQRPKIDRDKSPPPNATADTIRPDIHRRAPCRRKPHRTRARPSKTPEPPATEPEPRPRRIARATRHRTGASSRNPTRGTQSPNFPDGGRTFLSPGLPKPLSHTSPAPSPRSHAGSPPPKTATGTPAPCEIPTRTSSLTFPTLFFPPSGKKRAPPRSDTSSLPWSLPVIPSATPSFPGPASTAS